MKMQVVLHEQDLKTLVAAALAKEGWVLESIRIEVEMGDDDRRISATCMVEVPIGEEHVVA